MGPEEQQLVRHAVPCDLRACSILQPQRERDNDAEIIFNTAIFCVVISVQDSRSARSKSTKDFHGKSIKYLSFACIHLQYIFPYSFIPTISMQKEAKQLYIIMPALITWMNRC